MALIVASIDFGTTYSGWAFSFKHDYERDPTNVFAKLWHGGHFVSQKGPTCVLIKSDGKTLDKFGYEAETKYADLAMENKHEEWFYFKRFKMQLFNKSEINRNMTIEDANGKKLKALTVFSLAIQYLKDDLLKNSENKIAGGSLENDIHWVLTVPAIWNDAAKLFMRTAAKKAGIKVGKLSIALEPEAASLYCRHVPVERRVDTGTALLTAFQPGAVYLVLDAGGGTVDITVHEVTASGKLKELHKASGGAWGGTKVNDAYERFLDTITGGVGVMESFKTTHMDDYIDLFRDFEIKKRGVCQDLDTKVNLRLPLTLITLVKKITDKTMTDTILESVYSDDVTLVSDKIKVGENIIKSLFDESVTSTIDHMRVLLHEKSVRKCQTILTVGGFSESPMLRNAIKTAFPEMKMIVPQDAGLAVLKGAVIFGHDTSIIQSRVAKYTYGVKSWAKYNPAIHPASKVQHYDGQQGVRGAFDKLIEVGESISPIEPSAAKEYMPVGTDTSFDVKLYASTKKNPVFVDENDAMLIGNVTVDCLDNTGKIGGASVSLLFGGTEVEVMAVHKTTGAKTTATFELLD